MAFLIDTDIVSEVRKGGRRDTRKAVALEAWLAEVMSRFGDRVLPVDTAVAEQWGRMNAIRPLPVMDAFWPRRPGSTL